MAQAPSFRRRIAHQGLRELYDYWLLRSRDGLGMPRDAFDPIAMPRLLKNLILSDVSDGGRAIRYRLVGTEIVAAHGFDYTGLTIEELTSGSTLAFARRLYTLVVSRAAPVYSEGNFRWAEKEFHWTKRLHLPLSRGGEAVDMVLVGQFYEMEVGEEDLLVPAEPAEVTADRALLASER